MEVTITGADNANLILQPADIPPDCVIVRSSLGSGSRVVLMLDPVKPGACRIPPFRARCLQGRKDNCDLRSADTVIPIGTVVATGTDLPDIRDHDEKPARFQPTPVQTGAGIPWMVWLAVPILVAACIAIRIWRKRRVNPAWQAQTRLRKLAAKAALNPDTSDAFVQLTEVLRDYLDARLTLGARTSTSPEIIDALHERALCSGWIAQVLEDFLAAADRAKFAGPIPAAADFDDAAEKCLTLLQVLEFNIARSSRAGV